MENSGVYTFKEGSFQVTNEVRSEFQRRGFIILRGVLDKDEVDMALKVVSSQRILNEAYGVPDATGVNPSFVSLWNQPGNDVTGMIARAEKIAGTAQKLMGEEMYHYHSKLMMKDAEVGGAFDWHQDYGYWYHNGLVFPDCITVFIALDQATKENGCLQLLAGSHRCGKVDHELVLGQLRIDGKRIEEIKKRCPLNYLEMEPGDAVFFHGNTMHHSEQNNSPNRRWALVCCYNAASNNPYFEHHHSSYVPLKMVPNSSIKNCENLFDFSGKEFMDPATIKEGQLRYIRRGETLKDLRIGR